MNKRILALAVGLMCANVFATTYTINLSQMVKQAALENDYEWKDGKQTTNLMGYKCLVSLTSKLNGTLPKKGDSITITWDGYADGNVADLTVLIADNSAAANWWRELTDWDNYFKVGNLNKNQSFSINHTFVLSNDAADINGVCLFIKASVNASGLATLVSSNATAAQTNAPTAQTNVSSSAQTNSTQSKPASAKSSNNKTCGIDIIALAQFWGATTFDNSGESATTMAGAPEWIRIQTYDCFLKNNTFGVFGEMGIGSLSIPSYMKTFIFEMSVGPSYGINLGNSSNRFQVAAGLHFVKYNMSYSNKSSAISYNLQPSMSYTTTTNSLTQSAETSWIGFFVNPQFRFTTNKVCSFIVGLEVSADFGVSGSMTVTSNNDTQTWTPKTYIAGAPYIGLGINF